MSWNVEIFYNLISLHIAIKPEKITSTDAMDIENNAKLTDEELAYILEVNILKD